MHSWQLYTAAPLEKSDWLHHDLISHSVTGHWANQSMPYPNNKERQPRRLQESILYVNGFTRPGIELPTFHTLRTRRNGWINWASISRFRRSRDLNTPVRTLVESNQWHNNWYLSLPSQVLGINRFSVMMLWFSGISGHSASGLVS